MFNKNFVHLFILLLTLFCGQILCGLKSGSGGLGGGGTSTSNNKQDSNGNYQFSYEITDPNGAQNYRNERGDANNNVEGSYGLQDVDGRMRVVDYWADWVNGFRAQIRSNEPGVGNQDAADAIYNGPDNQGGGQGGGQGGKTGQTINHANSGGGFGGKLSQLNSGGNSNNNQW